MRQITLRPDLKTAGGEISDILAGGQFVGTLTLVYREGERITGAVQLDRDALKKSDKKPVISFLKEHIRSFQDAVGAASCDVIITCSRYEEIVAADYDDHFRDRETSLEKLDAAAEGDEAEYRLVLADDKHGRIQYDVCDDSGNKVADTHFSVRAGTVIGDISWIYEPDEDAIELVTELLVAEFDEEVIDSFDFRHLYEGDVLESIELTHEDLLDDPSGGEIGEMKDNLFDAVLVRDDGDVLTYEIYSVEEDNSPIGTATVDIQNRRLTGFIDFRNLDLAEDTMAIATILMRELDKERDYDGLNLSVMYKNELIDEYVIDNEMVH